MKVSLIIAAGGRGGRFLKETQERGKFRTNKLFVSLDGKPVLRHTLDAFEGISQIKEIILAIPPGTKNWVKTHVLKEDPKVSIRMVQGGATRAESVWRALQKTSAKNSWVLIHDGARPFPPKKAILELFRKCNGAEGAILARPVVPTLKRAASRRGYILETIDRSNLFEAETPQLVHRSFLLKAYQENPKAFSATDESSLVESVGGKVRIVVHSEWNVKITTPTDFHLAEAYLAKRAASNLAMGFGRDIHRLVAGRKLYLGGIQIPFEKGSLGHSDGDALLHAVADALLGAAGLGDIGDYFPPEDIRFKNVRSERLIKKILREIAKKGWRPERVDTVTILEKPRLAPYKQKIRQKISQILKIPVESISVKAKTQEGLGPEGEGLAVTCEALATLRRIP